MINRKLQKGEFPKINLKSSLRNVSGRHRDLVNRHGKFVSQLITDIILLS